MVISNPTILGPGVEKKDYQNLGQGKTGNTLKG